MRLSTVVRRSFIRYRSSDSKDSEDLLEILKNVLKKTVQKMVQTQTGVTIEEQNRATEAASRLAKKHIKEENMAEMKNRYRL